MAQNNLKVMTKLALVTGGSRGLGRSMALALANNGTDVILTYHSRSDAANEVIAEVSSRGQKAVALKLDVTEIGSFDNFANTFARTIQENFSTDKFDYLVNNAGMGVYSVFTDTTEDEFDLMMNAHLKAPFFLSQKLLPLMNDGGGIVNISSGLTRFAIPGYAAYSAAKGGIEVITNYQAKVLGPRRIRANTVAPGAVETDFGGGAIRDNADLNQFIASQTALGRAGLPDDIGPVVAFLCSDEAKWVNAQRIEVSGGQMI